MILENLKWEHVEVVARGSVYSTPNGKLGFAFFYKNEDGKKRKVVTGNSEEELRKKAIKFLNMIDDDCHIKKEEKRRALEELTRPLAFKEVGEQWLAEYKGRRQVKNGKITYASVESREFSLRAINKVIGDVPIKNIDDEAAECLLGKCSVKADGTYYSVSHVDKLQQVFRKVMEYGVEHGHCEKCPKKVVLDENLTEPDKDSRFLDENEILAVFKVVEENMRYKTLVHLLLATGLRQEEAFALNVNDFKELPTGNVEINVCKTVVEMEGHDYQIVNDMKTKNSKRKVYVPHEIYDMVMEYYNYVVENETVLQSYMRDMYNMEGYIFLNRDMKPINKRTFQNNFKKYLKRRAGSDMDFKATLHMFRHSFVSFQADKMSLDKVAMIIGDSLATTNKIYQSLTGKAKDEVCENTAVFYNRLKGEVEK